MRRAIQSQPARSRRTRIAAGDAVEFLCKQWLRSADFRRTMQSARGGRLALVSSAWKPPIGLPRLRKIKRRIEFQSLGIKRGAQIHLPDTRSGRSLPFPVLLEQIASLRYGGFSTSKQLCKLVGWAQHPP